MQKQQQQQHTMMDMMAGMCMPPLMPGMNAPMMGAFGGMPMNPMMADGMPGFGMGMGMMNPTICRHHRLPRPRPRRPKTSTPHRSARG
jgi:hypothetical protein